MNFSKLFFDNKVFLNNKIVVKEVYGYECNVVINILEKFFVYGKNEDGKILFFFILWNRVYSIKEICIKICFLIG